MATKDGKTGPLSAADLKFLGYEVEDRSKDLGDFGLPPFQHCRLFNAVIRAGIDKISSWFVYLLSDCPNDDIECVKRALESDVFKGERCHIVAPQSVYERTTLQPLKRDFSVHAYEDLMWTRVRQAFEGYMVDFKEQANHRNAEIYIQPPVHKGGESIQPIEYFSDFFSGKTPGGGLAVVTADAAVGKTTLARMIAKELAETWKESRVIPVLLTGEKDWPGLAEKSKEGDTLWDLLSAALNMENPFPLNDEEIFTSIAQKGYIALIFDGFDELRDINMNPRDNLGWLSGIAEDSSARILVTARTSFWQREIGDSGNSCDMFDLLKFSRKNAREYFQRYFAEKEDRNREQLCQKASRLYAQISGNSSQAADDADSQFSGLPAYAIMIADHVERGGDIMSGENVEKKAVVRQFFSDILARERTRQKIKAKPEELRRALSDVAISYDHFDFNDLRNAFAFAEIDFEGRAMLDHAFLARVRGTSPEKYQFKNEFLLHYLRASSILDRLEERNLVEKCAQNSELRRLIGRESNGKGFLPERVADFADKKHLREIANAHTHAQDGKLKSFLFHVLAKDVDLRFPGANEEKRSEEIFGLLAPDSAKEKRIGKLSIEGSIGGMSLQGWKILYSRFEKPSLIQCKVDEDTLFYDCQFVGKLELPRNLQKRHFEKCEFDNEAKLAFTEGAPDFTQDDVREYLKSALRRFRRNHFQPIQQSNWKRGKTREIEERFSLLEIMTRAGLIENLDHHCLEIKAIHEVSNFLDNDMLSGKVKTVFDRMKDKLNLS